MASTIPQMTVLGIAGPVIRWPIRKTFETFERISKVAPTSSSACRPMVCAAEAGDDDLNYNVDHVTITINMVDPEVGEDLPVDLLGTTAGRAAMPRDPDRTQMLKAWRC